MPRRAPASTASARWAWTSCSGESPAVVLARRRPRPASSSPGVVLAENEYRDKPVSKTAVGDCEIVPSFILGDRKRLGNDAVGTQLALHDGAVACVRGCYSRHENPVRGNGGLTLALGHHGGHGTVWTI